MTVRIRFIQDEDPTSPREWDNLGHMVCWHRNYNLGDEQPKTDPAEWLEDFKAENPVHVILPLWLYDHSGITMRCSPFSCPWDSGQVGFIYATPEDFEKMVGGEWDEARVIECLQAEVSSYDDYLTGAYYGFVTEKGEECDHGEIHWEHIDSCWGFAGELDESGVLEHIGEEYEALARKQWDSVGVEVR